MCKMLICGVRDGRDALLIMASFAAIRVLNCVFALVIFPAAFLYFMRGGRVIVDWEVISVGGVSGYASGVADSTSLLFRFTVTFIAA